MARPRKNNADYFSHDNNMRKDTKIESVRSRFGTEGYAWWCMLLEVLSESENFNLALKNDISWELLAGDFRVETKKLQEFIEYILKIGLIKRKNGYIFCPKLIERLTPLLEKRAKMRVSDAETLVTGAETLVTGAEMPQSKVKERKVNISKDIIFPKTLKNFRDARRMEQGKPPMTPRKQTEKQEVVVKALKWIDEFKEKGYAQHGMQFMKVQDEKRNKAVRALAIRAIKELGDKKDGLSDWWFSGNGEWANYEPENCLSSKTLERYLNDGKGIKKAKKEWWEKSQK